MSDPTKKSTGAGRPKKALSWPTGQFTINDLMELQKLETNPKARLKRVGIQNKIREALEAKEIQPVGKNKKVGMGRPSVIYERVVSSEPDKCEDPFAPENDPDYYSK